LIWGPGSQVRSPYEHFLGVDATFRRRVAPRVEVEDVVPLDVEGHLNGRPRGVDPALVLEHLVGQLLRDLDGYVEQILI